MNFAKQTRTANSLSVNRSKAHWSVWTICVSAIVWVTFAESTFGFQAPARGRSTYDLSFDFPPAQTLASGYGKLDIQIDSLKARAASSDERFDLVLEFKEWRGSNAPTIFRAEATLWIKANQKSGKTSILIPAFQVQTPEVKVTVTKTGGGKNETWDEVYVTTGSSSPAPCILFVNDIETPRATQLTLFNNGYASPHYRQRGSVSSIKTAPVTLPSFDRLAQQYHYHSSNANPFSLLTTDQDLVIGKRKENLPDQWLAFTNYKFVLLSKSEWNDLCVEFPMKRKAISQWVRFGGTLIVYDLNEADLVKAEEFKKMLAIGTEPFESSNDWRMAQPGRLSQYYPVRWSTVKSSKLGGQVATEFAMSRWGSGRFIVVRGDMSNWPSIRWQQLINMPAFDTHEPENLVRQKFYSEFDIPGVGKPPMVMYRLLILLFVVVIGPLNYVLLMRRKRLNLLLVTVPAISAATCLALFSYSIVKDGFQTHARIESITFLDQRTGEARIASRQNYYGASIPAEGYTFDKDTLVLFGGDQPRRPYRVTDLGEEYRISGGAIRSRSYHQFYLQSVKKTNAQLEVSPTSDGMKATNRLGGHIEILVLRDGNINYVGQDIEPGASVILNPTPSGRVDADVIQTIERFVVNQGSYGFREGFTTDVWIAELLSVGATHSLIDSPQKFPRPPGQSANRSGYLAVMSQSDLVNVYGEKTDVRQQLHLLWGIWK